MKRVHIHIDRLVLRGVDQADRRAVAAAMEQELSRRLGVRGVPEQLAGLGHRDRLPAARVTTAAGSKPAVIGAGAGGGVANALVPGSSAS
jgi:hypothetical protein